MKKNVKKYVSIALAYTLVLGSTYNGDMYAKAARKVSLTKTAKIEAGKSSVLKLKNSKGKVSWKVTKGKDIVKIVKKKKDSCTVKGIKKGNAVVKAVVGKKKLSCKVTVTNKKASVPTETPVVTEIPKVTDVPQTTDEPKITAEPSVQPTEAPTKTPEVTQTPEPEPTVKSDDKNEPEIPEGVKVVEYDGTNIGDIIYASEPIYVKIKEGVTDISSAYDSKTNNNLVYPFMQRDKIVGVSIPKSIKKIDDMSFTKCKNLKEVTILEGVESIGWGAFGRCDNLEKITIPNSVTNIDSYAFSFCENLKNITLPKNLSTMSEALFNGCINLEKIAIPESVTKIEALVFAGCESIQSIYIPKNVKNIVIDYTEEDDNGNEKSYINGVFVGCDNLHSIIVDPANPYYDSRKDCNAIIDTKTDSLIAGCENSVIVDGIKEIGECAFQACAGLTTIEIPASVEVIYNYAFSDCTNLKEVRLHSDEIKATDDAFEGCTSLNDNIIFV